jgi:rubredoxin
MGETLDSAGKEPSFERTSYDPAVGMLANSPEVPGTMTTTVRTRTFMCLICGWIYDEASGAPDDGIAPGTRWEEIPPNWVCPECGARKEDFEMVEV